MKQKLEIIFKPTDQFRSNSVSVPAMHSLEPTYDKLLSLIDDALKDNFQLIVVYTKRGFHSRSNIFTNSTWNRLRRDLNADVRAGMVERRFGQYLGDGFTIYFNGGAQ